jgi:hypothetical protein
VLYVDKLSGSGNREMDVSIILRLKVLVDSVK